VRKEFAGKTGLIVGGSSGIGKTVGRILLERGAEAVIILGKNEQKLRAAELELGSFGKVIIADSGQLDRLLAEIDSKFAPVDLLLNSAGVFVPKPFLELTGEDYDRCLNLNRGTFFITQHVARNLIKRGRGGAIVNIGSMWAKQAVQATPSSAYSMAKAGLHSLTQHLAMELASAKLRVNAVSPAVVETPIIRGVHPPSPKCTRRCRNSMAFIPSDALARRKTWQRLFLFCCQIKHLGSPAQYGMSMAA
jgi:NAD(P)-dependent dehydrogenase (short-subunit alcohol dehydrogenase family)